MNSRKVIQGQEYGNKNPTIWIDAVLCHTVFETLHVIMSILFNISSLDSMTIKDTLKDDSMMSTMLLGTILCFGFHSAIFISVILKI